MKPALVVLALAGWSAAGAGVARAQPAHLSPDDIPGGAIEPDPPEIDLVTFGVGERIFEKYGHAAICLRYHQPEHPEVCFNYGVTDFSAGPVMIWNFLRTQQRFWVEPTSFDDLYSFYNGEDRDIWLQTLPIAGADARAIEAKLRSDVQEANRYYYYDHFFDNCTTRLRDMIDRATHGALHAGTEAPYPLTFREIGRRGLAGMPPLLVATDLVIGRQADDHPTVWQAMFHPDVFRQQIEARLGVAPQLRYKRRGPAFPTEGSSGRLGLLAVGLAFALPLFIAQWRRRFQTAALVAVTLELALLGALVWGLAIVSSIAGVRYNEALVVVMPLDLVLPFLGEARRRRYAMARVGLLVLASLFTAIGVLHQPLWLLIVIVFVPMVTIALDLPLGLRRRSASAAPASAPDASASAPSASVPDAASASAPAASASAPDAAASAPDTAASA